MRFGVARQHSDPFLYPDSGKSHSKAGLARSSRTALRPGAKTQLLRESYPNSFEPTRRLSIFTSFNNFCTVYIQVHTVRSSCLFGPFCLFAFCDALYYLLCLSLVLAIATRRFEGFRIQKIHTTQQTPPHHSKHL